VEAEEAKRLQLALNYDAMASSPGFRDLVGWLDESVEALELKCATAEPEDERHFRAYFSEWQQRKMVVAGIKQRVRNQIETKIALEEEVKNERPSSDTYLDTGGSDRSLPGY
jgi:hypothetical protein